MTRRIALTGILCAAIGYLLGGLASPAPAAGPEDIAGEALAALKRPDRNARMGAFLDVIDAVDSSNARNVANVFESNDILITECEVRPFVRALADLSFDLAMPIIQRWSDENLNLWGLEEAAHGMVLAGDLRAAREFARSRRSEARRDAFVAGLIEGWADAGDLGSIGDYVRSMPDGGRRNLAIDPLLRGLIRRLGLAGAMDWVLALPDDTEPNGMARGSFLLVLRFAMITDPEIGRAWYEAHEDLPRALSGRSVVAAEWVEYDPEAASTWLLSQPDDLQSRTALFSGIERWLELDPEAAEAWLSRHLDNPLALAGVRPLVRHLAYERPLDAIAWNARIPDEMPRARNLAQAIHIWREVDEQAAEAWLDEADLPDATRRILGIEVEQ
jgi:hypothetical protein